MKKVVQLVDDSQAVRRALGHIFRAAGFEVHDDAQSGAEAILEALLAKPDLLVLDVRMPDMSGLRVAGIVHQILPASPIILFTLFLEMVQREQAHSLGVSAVLSKHTSAEALVRTAAQLLHLPVVG
jgi:CheY-like chemotaxis protein